MWLAQFPSHSAYGASKHGIDVPPETLQVELKHEGWHISVTQVMPGTINTPFFDKGRTKLCVKLVGIPPIYEPETVAKIILYAAENPARDLVSWGAAQAMNDTASNGFRAFSRSLYNWLQMHPVVRRGAAVGTALRLVGCFARKVVEPA